MSTSLTSKAAGFLHVTLKTESGARLCVYVFNGTIDYLELMFYGNLGRNNESEFALRR